MALMARPLAPRSHSTLLQCSTWLAALLVLSILSILVSTVSASTGGTLATEPPLPLPLQQQIQIQQQQQIASIHSGGEVFMAAAEDVWARYMPGTIESVLKDPRARIPLIMLVMFIATLTYRSARDLFVFFGPLRRRYSVDSPKDDDNSGSATTSEGDEYRRHGGSSGSSDGVGMFRWLGEAVRGQFATRFDRRQMAETLRQAVDKWMGDPFDDSVRDGSPANSSLPCAPGSPTSHADMDDYLDDYIDNDDIDNNDNDNGKYESTDNSMTATTMKKADGSTSTVLSSLHPLAFTTSNIGINSGNMTASRPVSPSVPASPSTALSLSSMSQATTSVTSVAPSKIAKGSVYRTASAKAALSLTGPALSPLSSSSALPSSLVNVPEQQPQVAPHSPIVPSTIDYFALKEQLAYLKTVTLPDLRNQADAANEKANALDEAVRRRNDIIRARDLTIHALNERIDELIAQNQLQQQQHVDELNLQAAAHAEQMSKLAAEVTQHQQQQEEAVQDEGIARLAGPLARGVVTFWRELGHVKAQFESLKADFAAAQEAFDLERINLRRLVESKSLTVAHLTQMLTEAAQKLDIQIAINADLHDYLKRCREFVWPGPTPVLSLIPPPSLMDEVIDEQQQQQSDDMLQAYSLQYIPVSPVSDKSISSSSVMSSIEAAFTDAISAVTASLNIDTPIPVPMALVAESDALSVASANAEETKPRRRGTRGGRHMQRRKRNREARMEVLETGGTLTDGNEHLDD
ncbi:hypothetical protein GQ42DRAFT_13507 [Ramicandelaber brevisporus]|nr:hypothetical protein GQ42DRAFT_13507 [Ramicandelaber brevisporus]